MKKLFASFVLLLFTFSPFAQVITSVANGNWYFPTTWSCTCIPLGTDTIVINHKVTLDNDFLLAGGSVTIGTSGSLKENANTRYFAMNSGNFTNDGLFNISHVALNGGYFLNNDSCIVNNQFYSNAPIDNYGIISNVDSLLLLDFLSNHTGATVNAFYLSTHDIFINDGSLNASNLSNFGVFNNSGNAQFVNFFNADSAYNNSEISFTDFTTTGFFYNNGVMTGAGNATNIGLLILDTLGQLLVHYDFSNVDTAHYEAYIYLDGLLHIGNDFYNRDTIFGEKGNICVVHSSLNNGTMQGSFDFCGLNSAGGHVDLNNGYISPAITYCTKSCAAGTSEVEQKFAQLSVYPNPAKSLINFEFDLPQQNSILSLIDITGRRVFYKQNIQGSNLVIESGQLPAGLYIYCIETSNKSYRGKLLIE